MATNSEHWYRRDGSSCYSLPTKNGGERAVSLRWDRALGLVPSVTTVLAVIAKPALTNWMVRQGIMAALTLPRIPYETDEAFLSRIDTDGRQQAKDAADEGTRIHDAIECAYKRKPVLERYRPHVDATVAKVREMFPDVHDWVAEKSFAHGLGFGGKVDLHSPSTGIVVDFKGKDLTPGDTKKLAYDQHWQLAAYNRGLGFQPAQCANVFVSRTTPGYCEGHVWTVEEIREGWSIFECALMLWKKLKRYDGAFK